MSNLNKSPKKRLQNLQSKVENYQKAPAKQAPSSDPRNMEQWHTLVEERIQAAMQDGQFDNLSGHGKPLKLTKNPYADQSFELAHGLLKNNDYLPDWIERDVIIRRELEIARQNLRTAWQYHQSNLANTTPVENLAPKKDLHLPDSETTTPSGWQDAIARFAEALNKINRKIDDYNLVVPIVSKQRVRLRLEDELRQIQKP